MITCLAFKICDIRSKINSCIVNKLPELINNIPDQSHWKKYKVCHDFCWFSTFSPFSSKSKVPTLLTLLNHDMLSHSFILSYLMFLFLFLISYLSSVISVKKAIMVILDYLG